MKKIYVAVDIEENGKRYAHVWFFSSNNNMIATFEQLKNAEIIHLCETKKKAIEIVESWNSSHKENGIYMFDYPSF